MREEGNRHPCGMLVGALRTHKARGRVYREAATGEEQAGEKNNRQYQISQEIIHTHLAQGYIYICIHERTEGRKAGNERMRERDTDHV